MSMTTMTSARMARLLDAPIHTLSVEDFAEIARELPDEWAFLVARIQAALGAPVPVWHMDQVQARAGEARSRRLLTERLACSIPFSVGAR